MTVREMQMSFDDKIQLVSREHEIKEKPDYYTIMLFLNRSQEKYIVDNFLSKAQVQTNIELIQKRSDILRNIIKRFEGTDTGALTATEVDGGIELALPTDYLYYIKSFSSIESTLSSAASGKLWTPNRVINHDELDKIAANAYNSPLLRKPCVLFEEDDKLILYKDALTSVYNISYVYLRDPKTLTILSPGATETNTCELDASTHNEIVELAVQMFIEDYKYKLQQAK